MRIFVDVFWATAFIAVLSLSPDSTFASETNGAPNEKPYGVVTVSVANMRRTPAHAAEMETQCLLGMPLRIQEKKGGWYRVLTLEEMPCWVTADSVVPMTCDLFNQWIKTPKTIYLRNTGFILAQARANARRVSDIVEGCVLACDGSIDGYFRVRFPDGRSGFILEKDCMNFEQWKRRPPPTGDELADKAIEFMGVPYLWGGTSSKMLDCSGLTKLCFFLHGVIIPRNASQQAVVGRPVDAGADFENVQKGDLLFFGTRATDERPERITHVGIYLGNGLCVHESGRVKIDKLDPRDDDFNKGLATSLVRIKRLWTDIGGPGIVPVAAHPLYGLQPVTPFESVHVPSCEIRPATPKGID